MHFDPAALAETLWIYVQRVGGAARYAEYRDLEPWPFQTAQAVVWVGLLVFAAAMLRKRQPLAAFFAGWFFIVLAPVLPLKHHVSDYYLTIPAIGLAMLGGWAMSHAFRAGALAKASAVGIALVYLAPSAWAASGMTKEVATASREVRTFVASVAGAHRRDPQKILIIRKVPDRLFWRAWMHNPFRLFGCREIFMSADSRSQIHPRPGLPVPSRYFLAETVALAGLQLKKAAVFDVIADGRLRENTVLYEAGLERKPDLTRAASVDVAKPLDVLHLGQGWWQIEGTYRWTSKRAVVKLAAPEGPSSRLVVRGFCHPEQLKAGPLALTVSVDGKPQAPSTLSAANVRFQFEYPLVYQPGASGIEVAVEADRTLRVDGDKRDLGLAFGTFEIVR
jgi:hypothetical protein